jgi:hypothetical protein
VRGETNGETKGEALLSNKISERVRWVETFLRTKRVLTRMGDLFLLIRPKVLCAIRFHFHLTNERNNFVQKNIKTLFKFCNLANKLSKNGAFGTTLALTFATIGVTHKKLPRLNSHLVHV